MTLAVARRVLSLEARALSRLARRVDSSFERAVAVLGAAHGRVVVTGMGKSGLIGAKIAATLSSTGTPAFTLDPAQALHGDMGSVTRRDVLLAISNSGGTRELRVLLPLLKKTGCRVVLLTGNPRGPLARWADVALDAGVTQEACPLNLAPTASTTAALALGDALAVALLERRGFKADDFARLHPGGHLGERLEERVFQVMRRGSAVPKLLPSASFQRTARVITAKKVGCALVVDPRGRLQGIVVDGDLRRALLKNPDPRGWTAGKMGHARPRAVSSDATLAQALQIMEENAVYQLVVLDRKKRPVGLLHLHDLLGRGKIRLH